MAAPLMAPDAGRFKPELKTLRTQVEGIQNKMDTAEKAQQELARIERACAETVDLFSELNMRLRTGMTEKQIAAIMVEIMTAKGLSRAWYCVPPRDLPNWLTADWRSCHAIEPEVFRDDYSRAGIRLLPMNSISWMVGHMAWHERNRHDPGHLWLRQQVIALAAAL